MNAAVTISVVEDPQVLDDIAVGPAQDAVAHVLTPRGQSGHDQARHAIKTAEVAGDKVGGQVGSRSSLVESAHIGTQFVEQVAESELRSRRARGGGFHQPSG